MTTPDGDAKTIEWTDPEGRAFTLRAYARDGVLHSRDADEGDLAAAGYVPASELEATRLALEQAKSTANAAVASLAKEIHAKCDMRDRAEQVSLDFANACDRGRLLEAQFTTERARAEETERRLVNTRDNLLGLLAAANARAGRLAGAVARLLVYPFDLRGQVGSLLHDELTYSLQAYAAALSAAPQASTEQGEGCRTCGKTVDFEYCSDAWHLRPETGFIQTSPIPQVAQASERATAAFGIGQLLVKCADYLAEYPTRHGVECGTEARAAGEALLDAVKREQQVAQASGERPDYCPACDVMTQQRRSCRNCNGHLIRQPHVDELCRCGHCYGAHESGTNGPCTECSACKQGFQSAPAQPKPPEPLSVERLALLLRRLSDVCFSTGGSVTHLELAWLADQLEGE